jgi:SOS-response transcriptional repressor LexA
MENRQIRYLNTRLLILRECEGEVTKLADRIGKSQPQTSAFAGENPTKGIGNRISREITAAFGKGLGWLDLPHCAEWQDAGLWKPEVTPKGGDGSGRVSSCTTLVINAHSAAVRHIPIISWVAAGNFSEAMDMTQPTDADQWVFTSASRTGPRSYALRVVGDSMTNPYPNGPTYPHGTIIVVDPDREYTVGSRVVVKRNGDEACFKVYTEDGGRRFLKPLNPQYPIVEMTDDYEICGVVIGRWMDD